jgi:iron(III) transport system permease protein
MAILLGLILAVPVLLPVRAAFGSPVPDTAGEAGRIAELAGWTLALAFGAVLVAVPGGTLLALVVERSPVPGRRLLRSLVLVGLFVPLPVYAIAWQVVLGSWLPPLTLEPGQVAWRPWSLGLVPAAWVHGMAGLPWVAWIVAAGLHTTDRGLEEDALVEGGPWAVFRRVLLPRAALAAVAAGGWVAAQAMTEIPVTDAMMVRTFAEEVYTQLVSSSEGWAGAVAVTLPAWAAAVLVGGWIALGASRAFGAPPAEARRSQPLRLGGAGRWLTGMGAWLAVLAFDGLPLAALVWKAGGGGSPAGWTHNFLENELVKVARSDGLVLLGSAGTASAVGLAAAALAWPACRLAAGSRGFGRFLFGLCVVLAVTPGPIAGRGLKLAINDLLDIEERVFDRLEIWPTFYPLKSALYDQPSPLPAGWATLVRLFPIAVAVLWPAVRAIPRDLDELARMDGLGVLGTWKRVVVPLTAPAAGWAVVAVAALALGEVSASKLVNPPSRPTYILRVFDQMHYGADSTVAALSLLQLAATAGLIVLGSWLLAYRNSGSARRTG